MTILDTIVNHDGTAPALTVEALVQAYVDLHRQVDWSEVQWVIPVAVLISAYHRPFLVPRRKRTWGMQ